jgi:hypothetical protein
MSNFRAMTRATEYGLANGIPGKYKDWQPANWVDENKGVDFYFKYIVVFDDGFSYAVRFCNLIETKNRFECDEQMPLPKLTDINVGNPFKKIINKLKSYCRRFI